jgi:hypothetical protein
MRLNSNKKRVVRGQASTSCLFDGVLSRLGFLLSIDSRTFGFSYYHVGAVSSVVCLVMGARFL